MIASARLLLIPTLLFSLAACGLKGPLYLPDEQPEAVPAQKAPQSTPAQPSPAVTEGSKVRTPLPPIPQPQSQKKDREKANSSATPPPQGQ